MDWQIIINIAAGAALSVTGWFWNVNRLNALADAQDVKGMCRRINGGFNGLEDRQMKYSRLMDYFRQSS